MSVRFDVVSIIGVGLLGGSLGLALKARQLARTVLGVGHRQSSLDSALAVKAIDQAFLDLRPGIAEADLIVICTPAALVPSKLDEIRPLCSSRAVATDVASTKAAICAHAAATWPKPLRFVGSHPMAGSEKFGPEHAQPDLYQGYVTIVTSDKDTDPEAHQTVCELWRAVGARVVELDAETHDRIVAQTSHVPHLLAACLAEVVARAGDVSGIVGNGFRDMTRVAAGRSEIWRDICTTNREAILAGLDTLADELARARRLVAENAGEGLETFFRSAQQARRKVLGE
ncbi:MAG: prephenate dehydrogenase/arogenate dehydrogenase family protein [Candidatus Hydrogenedentes bacterium]|nr:prephenate dehydrogenase/arogenate dehydrogenase family protein [Candidatus Hydrogenedentota bacterium]